MKFNLKKHLMKHKIFGIGLGYLILPKGLEELLVEGFVEKEQIKEIISILYLESIDLLNEIKSLEEKLEKYELISGTNLYTDIFLKYKDKKFKINRLSTAIKKIERFYL